MKKLGMALAAVGMALAVVTVAMAMMGQPEGPTGACCLPNGLCFSFLTPDSCAVSGGSYQGDGTLCLGGCGACCLPDTECMGNVEQVICTVFFGGDYQGQGSTCKPPFLCPGCEGDPECDDGDPCNGIEACFDDGTPRNGGVCGPNPPDPDCDGNGVLDSCDIAGGTPDCNGNGVPDECDIAGGASQDFNNDGVPDDCQCLSDIDNDGTVGITDFLKLLADWGTCQ